MLRHARTRKRFHNPPVLVKSIGNRLNDRVRFLEVSRDRFDNVAALMDSKWGQVPVREQKPVPVWLVKRSFWWLWDKYRKTVRVA